MALLVPQIHFAVLVLAHQRSEFLFSQAVHPLHLLSLIRLLESALSVKLPAMPTLTNKPS